MISLLFATDNPPFFDFFVEKGESIPWLFPLIIVFLALSFIGIDLNKRKKLFDSFAIAVENQTEVDYSSTEVQDMKGAILWKIKRNKDISSLITNLVFYTVPSICFLIFIVGMSLGNEEILGPNTPLIMQYGCIAFMIICLVFIFIRRDTIVTILWHIPTVSQYDPGVPVEVKHYSREDGGSWKHDSTTTEYEGGSGVLVIFYIFLFLIKVAILLIYLCLNMIANMCLGIIYPFLFTGFAIYDQVNMKKCLVPAIDVNAIDFHEDKTGSSDNLFDDFEILE